VLENAFNGFNTSLFAYGQTGAGKSYSMVGYGVNRGIVPITCDEMFKAIDRNSVEGKVRFQVTFSKWARNCALIALPHTPALRILEGRSTATLNLRETMYYGSIRIACIHTHTTVLF